jgi:hypothetical protein
VIVGKGLSLVGVNERPGVGETLLLVPEGNDITGIGDELDPDDEPLREPLNLVGTPLGLLLWPLDSEGWL